MCVCAYGLQPAPVLFAMCTDEAEKEQHAVSHTHLPKQNKSLLAVKSTPVCMHWAQEERGKQRKWTQRIREKENEKVQMRMEEVEKKRMSRDGEGKGMWSEREQREHYEDGNGPLTKLKVEEIHRLIHKHLDDGANFLAIS